MPLRFVASSRLRHRVHFSWEQTRQEQCSLFSWWNWTASKWPDAVMFAIPNGGWRSLPKVLAGLPDEDAEIDMAFGARWPIA